MDTVKISPYTGRPIDHWIEHDIELHDVDGDEIGKIVEVNPDFVVAWANTGFLGLGEPRLYYVPRDQIMREDENDWYIAIDKDVIESKNWTQVPAGSAWSADWSDRPPAWLNDKPRRTRVRSYEE